MDGPLWQTGRKHDIIALRRNAISANLESDNQHEAGIRKEVFWDQHYIYFLKHPFRMSGIKIT